MRVGAFSEGKGLGSCDGNAGDGWARRRRPLCLVPPAPFPLWYSLCGSVVNDGEDYSALLVFKLHFHVLFLRTLCTTHSVVVNNNKVRAQLP